MRCSSGCIEMPLHGPGLTFLWCSWWAILYSGLQWRSRWLAQKWAVDQSTTPRVAMRNTYAGFDAQSGRPTSPLA